MAGGSATKVVQITNIAPQATKDQMAALFGLLGKIEEIRLCMFQFVFILVLWRKRILESDILTAFSCSVFVKVHLKLFSLYLVFKNFYLDLQ